MAETVCLPWKQLLLIKYILRVFHLSGMIKHFFELCFLSNYGYTHIYTVCFLHIHFLTIYFKILILGDVERAQWLRSLGAFAENPGLGPSTHNVAHNPLKLQCPPLASLGTGLTRYTHIHADKHLYTWNKNFKRLKILFVIFFLSLCVWL